MSAAVVILGAGGHARVVADLLAALNRRVIGVVTRDGAAADGTPRGLPLLGADEALIGHDPETTELANGVGSVGSLAARDGVFQRFRARGFRFPALVHPRAHVAPDARIDEGAQVMAGAVVQTGAAVGANSIVNTLASVDHDCVLAQSVHVAPGAVLSGGVRVGARTHIGTGAVVIQSVTIGTAVLVAAGAVVTRDLPDGAVVHPPRARVA